MALQSQLFRGDPKLEAAAVSDPAHILSGANGPHVGKIQLALVQLDGAAIAQDSVYGPSTAVAVRAFKQKRQILNSQGRIDDIVGKKTMAALDGEMLAKERGSAGGGGRLGFKIVGDDTPFGPPPPRQVGDVVVRFQGAFAEGGLTPDSVLSARRVLIYKRVPGSPGIFAAVLVNPFNGRFLLRVGRKTTTIGAASLGVFASVLSEMQVLLLGLQLAPGKIFIHGSSSGGRNAIDFAAHATRLGFKPHLVASVDAAFFQADTSSRPDPNPVDPNELDHPKRIPDFSVDAGSTPQSNRHNFFQTIGNHTRGSLFQGVLFTSKMKGEEIHGRVVGFRNNDLSRFLPRPLLLTDDEAHGECGIRGNADAERLIADDLLLNT